MTLEKGKLKKTVFQNRIFYAMLIPGVALTFIFSVLTSQNRKLKF